MTKIYVFSLWACLVFSPYCFGQTPVNIMSTVSNIVVAGGSSSQTISSHSASVNGIQASTNYSVSYNNTGNVGIIDFTLSGKTYVRYANFDTVILRRVANTWETTGGNKQHIYCEGPLIIDNLFHTIPFPAAYPQVTNHAYMERVMKDGYINRGSDNVFNNDPNSDQTSNNIERVDFISTKGAATKYPALAGFLIAERGGNDAFKIAAITGIDANKNPTSFGPVLTVNTASYGLPIMTAATYVMRKDATDNVLRPFSMVTAQSIRSVYISFSHLGVSALQEIYGYALMASDVTATTSAQVLDYTSNIYFPRNTTSATGGMDLASAPGIFQTDLVLAGHYLTLGAVSRNCSHLIQWSDMEFSETKAYELERSYDGAHFEKIASLPVGNQAGYSYSDSKADQPVSYYRIKVLLERGSSYYSSMVYTAKTCNEQKVSLYPNPVKDQLTVTTTEPVAEITILAANGKEFGKWSLTRNDRQIKLDLSQLPSGHYFVRLKSTDGAQKAYPVLKL